MLKHTVLKTTNIARSLALVIVLIGCQDEVIIENTRGDIVGFVNLIDEDGMKIQNASDVKVSLDKDHSVMSNSDGHFEFKDVEAGTYHIAYEKEGFGMTKKFNYLFTAGNVPGVLGNVGLIELSSVKLIDKSIEVSGSSVNISGTLQETDSYYFIYYFFDKANAKPGEAITSYASGWCCSPTTAFSQIMQMPSNATLYLGVYAVSKANQNNQYGYYDYEQSVYVNSAMKELVAPVKVR